MCVWQSLLLCKLNCYFQYHNPQKWFTTNPINTSLTFLRTHTHKQRYTQVHIQVYWLKWANSLVSITVANLSEFYSSVFSDHFILIRVRGPEHEVGLHPVWIWSISGHYTHTQRNLTCFITQYTLCTLQMFTYLHMIVFLSFFLLLPPLFSLKKEKKMPCGYS